MALCPCEACKSSHEALSRRWMKAYKDGQTVDGGIYQPPTIGNSSRADPGLTDSTDLDFLASLESYRQFLTGQLDSLTALRRRNALHTPRNLHPGSGSRCERSTDGGLSPLMLHLLSLTAAVVSDLQPSRPSPPSRRLGPHRRPPAHPHPYRHRRRWLQGRLNLWPTGRRRLALHPASHWHQQSNLPQRGLYLHREGCPSRQPGASRL